MGILSEFRKSCRNREDYKAKLIQAQRVIDNKDREIAILRRKLANIRDYTDRALA